MVASGDGFVKSTDNPRNHDWKEINKHMKSGSDLGLEKQFPKISGNLNQKERFGGFDLIQKTNIPTHLISSRLMHVSSFKWTQAHFSLKISADLEGNGQQLVKWANFVHLLGLGLLSKPNMAIWPKPNSYKLVP